MNLWIDASVQRERQLRFPTRREFVERASAGKREIKIEFRNLLAAKIFNTSPFECSQCDRRVEVVKDLYRPLNIKHVIDDARSFRAKAGADYRIALGRAA